MQFDRHYQIHAHTPTCPDREELVPVLGDLGLSVFTITNIAAYGPAGMQPAIEISLTITGEPAEGEKDILVTAAARVAKLFGLDAVLLTVTPMNAALISAKGEVIVLEDEPEESQIISAADAAIN